MNFNMGLSYKFGSLYFNSNINMNFSHSIFLQETAWLPTWQEQQEIQYNVVMQSGDIQREYCNCIWYS
jgi:hypothetical protein